VKLSRYDAGAAVVYVSLLIASINVLGGCSAGSVEERVSADAPPSAVMEDENTLALRQRATEFGDLLERLQNLSRDEAYYELQFYLEPSPELRERVIAYFRDFSIHRKTATIRSQQVSTIVMAPSGDSAHVTYETVFDMAPAVSNGLGPVSALQETEWKRIDGAWYRTSDDAAVALR